MHASPPTAHLLTCPLGPSPPSEAVRRSAGPPSVPTWGRLGPPKYEATGCAKCGTRGPIQGHSAWHPWSRQQGWGGMRIVWKTERRGKLETAAGTDHRSQAGESCPPVIPSELHRKHSLSLIDHSSLWISSPSCLNVSKTASLCAVPSAADPPRARSTARLSTTPARVKAAISSSLHDGAMGERDAPAAGGVVPFRISPCLIQQGHEGESIH